MPPTSSTTLGFFRSDQKWWSRSWAHRSTFDSYAAAHSLQQSMPRMLLLLEPASNTVSGVATARKANRADDFRYRLELQQWFETEPFDLRDALGDLPPRLRAKAMRDLSEPLAGFTAQTAAHVLSWIQVNSPRTLRLTERLGGTTGPDWLRDDGFADVAEAYGQQMDGIKIAAEIAGLDRTQVLDAIRVPSSPEEYADQRIRLLEDQIVQRDAQIFPDWFRAISPYGSVFEELKTGRRLTVVLSNKNPAEKYTGADLIYYVEDYDAFTLVQYKRCRLEGRSGSLVYRPDGQLKAELQRFDTFAVPTGAELTVASARLANTFTFVKLCDPSQPLSSEFSTGMYLDTQTFGVVTQSGPRGGLRVAYGDVSRYVTNSTFCGLVGQGWIGSAGRQSEAVGEALEKAFDEDRRVILASVRLSHPGARPGRSRQPAQRLRASTHALR